MKKNKIEFRIGNSGQYPYELNVYVNGEYCIDMIFDKNNSHSWKIYQFNKIIEKTIEKYGREENFASTEDMNNNSVKLNGICLSIDNELAMSSSLYTASKYQKNCYSKSKKVVVEIYKALKPHQNYIRKALGGE